MLVRQVEFKDHDGHVFLAWVDAKWQLAQGKRITGKDKRDCTVVRVYGSIHDVQKLNNDWKVGGLD